MTGSTIMAAAMTFKAGDVQYVAVLTGSGGGNYAYLPNSVASRYGNDNRVLVFRLGGGKVPLPEARPAEAEPIAVADGASPQQVAAGDIAYGRYCSRCHAFGPGIAPDLRRSPAVASTEALEQVLLHGALRGRGMPRFDDVLGPSDVINIRAYLAAEARRARAGAEPAPTRKTGQAF